MKSYLFQACIELTNHRLSSFLVRSFATSSFSKFIIPAFARTFKLNEAEMERPLYEYKNLHDLFTRRLKEGTRIVEMAPECLVSPVDGILSQYGELEQGTTFMVKGKQYNLKEMLGSTCKAKSYEKGTYLILYLSPSHYHRIHSPINGKVTGQWKLGDRSYPVNQAGLQYGKRPLSRNFRIITELEVNKKKLALVKVGAMNINTIEVTHQSEELQKGDEIGYFSFGSTVVLLAEEGLLSMNDIKENSQVLMGQAIATIK